MKLFYLCCSFLFLPFFMLGQKGSDTKTEVYLDSAPPKTSVDSFYYSIPNVISLSFMEGFNDSVFVFRNGKCIDSLYLITNESIGLAGSMMINFKSSEEVIDLELRFKSSGTILRERLNLNYKHLQIRRLAQWGYYYSNQFPMLE